MEIHIWMCDRIWMLVYGCKTLIYGQPYMITLIYGQPHMIISSYG